MVEDEGENENSLNNPNHCLPTKPTNTALRRSPSPLGNGKT